MVENNIGTTKYTYIERPPIKLNLKIQLSRRSFFYFECVDDTDFYVLLIDRIIRLIQPNICVSNRIT